MYNQYQGINVTFYLKVFALSAEGHQAESEIEKAWIVSIVPIISSLLFALLKIISNNTVNVNYIITNPIYSMVSF